MTWCFSLNLYVADLQILLNNLWVIVISGNYELMLISLKLLFLENVKIRSNEKWHIEDEVLEIVEQFTY